MQYIAIFEVAICNITNWHIVSALLDGCVMAVLISNIFHTHPTSLLPEIIVTRCQIVVFLDGYMTRTLEICRPSYIN